MKKIIRLAKKHALTIGLAVGGYMLMTGKLDGVKNKVMGLLGMNKES